MIRVGIVGSGFMGSTHAEAYTKLSGVEIVGFVGKGEERRKALAAKYSTGHFGLLRDLLAHKPDIVDICLPSYLNREAVEAATGAGAHVLVEKPIALSLEDADAIVESARRNSVKLMVAHVLRFWPEYVKIRELLTAGDLGEPLTASAIRAGAGAPPGTKSWGTDFSRSGGVSANMNIHDFDICNWLFGKALRVYATATEHHGGGWFDMNAIITYEHGVSVSIKASSMMAGPYPFTMGLRVQGTAATVEYFFQSQSNVRHLAQARREFNLFREDGTAAALPTLTWDPYVAELEYFVRCVRENREPESGTGEQARLALAIALACNRSAEEGRVIEL